MNRETLEGKVVFELRNTGSKCEHLGPVLYYTKDKKEQHVLMVHENDNPFEYKTLVPYDKKYVQVNGRSFQGRFIVASIKEVNASKDIIYRIFSLK